MNDREREKRWACMFVGLFACLCVCVDEIMLSRAHSLFFSIYILWMEYWVFYHLKRMNCMKSMLVAPMETRELSKKKSFTRSTRWAVKYMYVPKYINTHRWTMNVMSTIWITCDLHNFIFVHIVFTILATVCCALFSNFAGKKKVPHELMNEQRVVKSLWINRRKSNWHDTTHLRLWLR